MSQAITLPSSPVATRERVSYRAIAALWPVAFFFVLTAIMTYPLITNMGGSIIHGVTADADVSRWDLWWVKTTLLQRHSNPFYTDMLYYPYRQASDPLNLYYHTLQPFNALLALPFLLISSPVVGPTLGYNVVVFIHFVLTGLAMFWLVRYLTGNTFAGLVSGVLFTFSPTHQYHLQYGQLELIPFEWIPLFVLFLHKLIYRPPAEQKRWLNGGLAFGCLVAASFTSWYITLYMLIAGGLLVLVRLWELRKEPREWRTPLLYAGAVVLAWLVVVGPFLYVTMRAAQDPSFELVSGLDYEARFSLSPWNILGVSKDMRFDPAVWNIGSLGFTAMILGCIGAWRAGRKGLFWFVLVVVGTVMALGPYLHFNDVIGVGDTTGIPLPYLLLRNLPFLSISRVPRRFIILTTLGLDVLAGYAVMYLMGLASRARERWKPLSPRLATGAAMSLLVLVPMLELATVPQPAQKVFISPFFSQIKKSGGSAILEMPITSHYLRDHARMLYQTVHEKKIIGGYTARRVVDYYLDYDSPFYMFIELNTRPKKDIVPPMQAAAVLNYYDIPYLVFYKEDESYEQSGDKERVDKYVKAIMPPSAIVQDDQQLTAYKVPTVDTTVPLIWVGNGWYGPESSGNDSWRWGSGRSDIRVNNKQPASLPMKFQAGTYRGEANLTVSVDGKAVKSFKIGQHTAEFDAGTLELSPGEHKIVFTSDAPPVKPSEAGGAKNDERQLAFVIRDLQLR